MSCVAVTSDKLVQSLLLATETTGREILVDMAYTLFRWSGSCFQFSTRMSPCFTVTLGGATSDKSTAGLSCNCGQKKYLLHPFVQRRMY